VSAARLQADKAEITRALAVMFTPDAVIELRVPKARQGATSGYFNDHARLVQTIAAMDAKGFEGVYLTLNPVNPALLARANNRVRERARETTADRDVVSRTNLLIDIDADRPAGISASDAEHDAALELTRQIPLVLAKEGWPAPIIADSGNGGHLVYRIALPNDDDSRQLLERLLKALATRFGGRGVHIDQTVFNASRIAKVYGTIARKGENTAERPWRPARLLDVPPHMEVLPRELMQKFIAAVCLDGSTADFKSEQKRKSGGSHSHRFGSFSVESWITKHHLVVRDPVAHEGGRKWVFEECPFDPEHKAPDAAVFEHSDGKPGFHCFHNSCVNRGWKELRARIEGSRPGSSNGSGRVHEYPDFNQTDSDDTPHGWRHRLLLTLRSQPRANLYNAVLAFREAPEWRGLLRLNRFSQEIELTRDLPWGPSDRWTDAENARASTWLQGQDIEVSSSVTAEAVMTVADENSYHPVVDYLHRLVWDGEPRVDMWLSAYFNTPATNYSAAVGRRWLISAVARVMKPGCKADCALVLEGPQGQGKSYALSILAGQEWFTDDVHELGTKDGVMQIAGKWIAELSDLHQFRGQAVERIKSFLSRGTDRVRLPYARSVSAFPRQCIFAGTTNVRHYLTDDSGNRRWWPVECAGRIKLDDLRRDRDQLWAEAVALYQGGAMWWLEPGNLLQEAEMEQAARLEQDPWTDLVVEYTVSHSEIRIVELLTDVLHKQKGDWTRRDEMRISAILNLLGFECCLVRAANGHRLRVYRRPD
jgi:predicted P-loop ATPase